MSLIYGKEGVVKKGTTLLSKIERINLTVEADTVIARCMGSDWADKVMSGVKSVRGEISKFLVGPEEILNELINGTELTIEVYPQGEGTGKPKFTITGAVIEFWGYTQPFNDFVREGVRFTGRTITPGTQ